MSAQEQWPGTAEEYRELLKKHDECIEQGERQLAGTYAIAAQIAGLAQVLDKIAYAARKR